MRYPRSYHTHGDAPAADTPAQPVHPAAGPQIRALSREECEEVLHRNVVGRIAYAFGGRVDIVPIHYAYEDGWLYARTSPGHKLETWRHSHWVAFEVDEVRALFDWTSVVVHGEVYVLSPEGPAHLAAAWEHAVGLLRRIVAATGTPHDPVPWRTALLRIHAGEISGRTATPAPGPS
jgi:nitroimidazol reductase NimA-like FMN-containing flavoprotein (pyridoxamine 5'-phosphate oxidase superfamily)